MTTKTVPESHLDLLAQIMPRALALFQMRISTSIIATTPRLSCVLTQLPLAAGLIQTLLIQSAFASNPLKLSQRGQLGQLAHATTLPTSFAQESGMMGPSKVNHVCVSSLTHVQAWQMLSLPKFRWN
jgi:hypothetical protein